MSDLKKQVIDGILAVEGGYVNDPSDSGGETNYGITISTARRYGYLGSMDKLPRSVAFDIYAKRYWDALELDSIVSLSPAIAAELADTGVNMGVSRAGEFLQRSLNVLNDRERYYSDLKVDGDVGPATLRAFKSYLRVRGSDGEKVLVRMLNALQGAFYMNLAERRTKDERFIFGWFLHRVTV